MGILKTRLLRHQFMIAFGHIFQPNHARVDLTGIPGLLAIEEQVASRLGVDIYYSDSTRGGGMLHFGMLFDGLEDLGSRRLDCSQGQRTAAFGAERFH